MVGANINSAVTTSNSSIQTKEETFFAGLPNTFLSTQIRERPEKQNSCGWIAMCTEQTWSGHCCDVKRGGGLHFCPGGQVPWPTSGKEKGGCEITKLMAIHHQCKKTVFNEMPTFSPCGEGKHLHQNPTSEQSWLASRALTCTAKPLYICHLIPS